MERTIVQGIDPQYNKVLRLNQNCRGCGALIKSNPCAYCGRRMDASKGDTHANRDYND